LGVGALTIAIIAISQVPLLILANKSDLKESLTASEVHVNLGLDLIRNRNWHIASSCALTGQGLVGGLDWLVWL
jgi:signal recognition particle receptor subunit beta